MQNPEKISIKSQDAFDPKWGNISDVAVQHLISNLRGGTSDAHENRDVCPIKTQNTRNFGSDKRLAAAHDFN